MNRRELIVGMLAAAGATAATQAIPFNFSTAQVYTISLEDAFLVNLFRVLAINPDMTATVVIELMNDRGLLA